MNPTFLKLTIAVISCLTFASTKQKAGTTQTNGGDGRLNRVCTQEFGMTVCRNPIPMPVAAEKELPLTELEPGSLILLKNIPSNMFERLTCDPKLNREYHAKRSWDYRPAPPPPPSAGNYEPVPLLPDGQPVWKYRPTKSFKYQPTRDWTYDRDVFGRIWRANIKYDTDFVVLPLEFPGVYMLPVGNIP